MRKETPIKPEDEINVMFSKAEANGWKKWGKFYKKNGSSYQCFRKGNQYIWIGFTFIQSTKFAIAIDYRTKFKQEKNEQIINEILS